jgi:hypothetical protein
VSSCYPAHAPEATPVAKLSVLTWIGNAAACLLGKHGAITHQAHEAGCSRQTVYDHAAKVQQAVADAHEPGPSRDQLLADNRRLRDENRQLWLWLEEALEVPAAQQRRFAVTAASVGLSLQQILALLAIVLPARGLPSRATLGRWVNQAARRAGCLLQVLDRACQPVVLSLCLDEIFFHRQPVLMGIEPFSLAWVLGQRTADRSGPTWAKAVAAWPQLRDVAADGGSGLELGLELATQKRRAEADQTGGQPVPLHAELDVFHTSREGGRATRADWQAAEACWEEAEKVERAKKRFDRGGSDGRHFKKSVVTEAWAVAEAAFAEADRKENAWQRAQAALRVFRVDGRLNDRAWATAEIQAAVAVLTGPRWAKTRRMLLDPRTVTFLERLHTELALAEPNPERREALLALWRWRHRRRPRGDERACGPQADLVESLAGLIALQLGAGWQVAYRRVARVLGRVLRASSAVECVHSVVRMHQGRHRNLSQELLDLKRLFWNCRSFVSGKRKGRCPYEHLGLKLPSYDPWVLLQMGPEELQKQLSSSGVEE